MWVVIKAAVWVVLVPGLLVGYFPYYFATKLWVWHIDFGTFRYAAWPFWAVGASILGICGWYFARDASASPAHFENPRHLIIRGPYWYVRNPMYLAQLVILFGNFLWFGSPLLLLYLTNYTLAVCLLVILYEEPLLNRLFGEEYELYRRHVPRWIPRLKWYAGQRGSHRMH